MNNSKPFTAINLLIKFNKLSDSAKLQFMEMVADALNEGVKLSDNAINKDSLLLLLEEERDGIKMWLRDDDLLSDFEPVDYREERIFDRGFSEGLRTAQGIAKEL